MKVYLVIETENTYESHSCVIGVYKDETKAIQERNRLASIVFKDIATYDIDEYELIE